MDFSKIDRRGFELSQNDLRMLRGMYRRINPDVSLASLSKLPRNFLIEKILSHEFTEKTIKKYNEHCRMLREFEKRALGDLKQINNNYEEECLDESNF